MCAFNGGDVVLMVIGRLEVPVAQARDRFDIEVICRTI